MSKRWRREEFDLRFLRSKLESENLKLQVEFLSEKSSQDLVVILRAFTPSSSCLSR